MLKYLMIAAVATFVLSSSGDAMEKEETLVSRLTALAKAATVISAEDPRDFLDDSYGTGDH